MVMVNPQVWYTPFQRANQPGRALGAMVPQQAGVFVTPNNEPAPEPAQTITPIPQGASPYQRAFAKRMLATGSSTAPVQSPLEGLARALTGVAGGYFAGEANRADEAREAAIGGRMGQLLGLSPEETEGLTPEQILGTGTLMSERAKAASAQEAAEAKAEAAQSKEQFSQEKNIRSEFSGLSKDFRAQRQGYERVLASAKNPSNAGDIALIFSFMRVLDPASTVREGEYATARNAGNIPERIRAEYNRLIDGKGQLTEGQRADFVNRSGMLYGAALESHRSLEDEYRGLADAYGVDASRSVPDYVRGLEPEAIEAVAVETPAPAPPAPSVEAGAEGEGGEAIYKPTSIEDYAKIPEGARYQHPDDPIGQYRIRGAK